MSFTDDHKSDAIHTFIAQFERLGFERVEDGTDVGGKPYLIMSASIEDGEFLDIKLTTTGDDT